MAVKTEFSEADFVQILAEYDRGKLRSFTPMTQGAVQTTYALETSTGKYIFRYYENRSHGSVMFESEVVQYLNAQHYPCPLIFSNRRGKFVGTYRDKPFSLFEFVDGEHVQQPDDAQQRQLVEQVAHLHHLTENYRPAHTEHRLNYSVDSCRELAQNAAATLNTDNVRAKLAWYEYELSQLEFPASLPKGVCHCDFHFSNILFKNGEFRALIDFDDANYTWLIYDLATLINPFIPAFEWDTWHNFGRDDDVFDFSEARRMTQEYQKYRELSRDEQNHLFDVVRLGIMLDCIWYFARGDAADFYERRKIDHLNRLGRENFTRALF